MQHTTGTAPTSLVGLVGGTMAAAFLLLLQPIVAITSDQDGLAAAVSDENVEDCLI